MLRKMWCRRRGWRHGRHVPGSLGILLKDHGWPGFSGIKPLIMSGAPAASDYYLTGRVPTST